MADRVGIINKGELILVEEKTELMRKLGKKQLTLQLSTPQTQLPPELATYPLALSADGSVLTYTFDARSDRTGHRHADQRARAAWASDSRTCTPPRARSKTSSSAC